MNDTALFAVLVACIVGVLAGRAWAAAIRRDRGREGAGRRSPHYVQGLHYLATGRVDLASTELAKVTRDDPDAVEVLQVLGNLLREQGQVQRAINAHQTVLARDDLSRSERAYVLACLGSDYAKSGFLDRATSAFDEVLQVEPKNLHALAGMQKLQEDQRHWRDAYDTQTRLARVRKTDDSVVLAHLQAQMGQEALALGQRDVAEKAFRTALSLDARVLPAHLGLADLDLESAPRRALEALEKAVATVPERAYLAFDRLQHAYAACGEPSRFAALCERIIRDDPRDWRARVALARVLRGEGRPQDAFGLLLRAVEAHPHALLPHLEIWRTLRELGLTPPEAVRYIEAAEEAVFYRDPHVCTACRYRAGDMLWRCPHCHRWDTFVEERVSVGA